jgi:hypothetical protein
MHGEREESPPEAMLFAKNIEGKHAKKSDVGNRQYARRPE